MVKNDQISIHEIVAIKSVACILRVHDIFINNISGSFSSIRSASSYLPKWTMFSEEIEECRRIDVVGQVFDEQNAIGFWGQLVRP